MPYLIDGHNLIGQIENISLDEPEDELRLIQLLAEFLKNNRKSGTVYFDRRGPGAQRKFKVGRLQVEFATSPNTADLDIRKRLIRLKGEAKNYTVVSSDREVIQAAKDTGAQAMDSFTFIRQLQRPYTIHNESEKPEGELSSEDLQFWQQIFENPPKTE
jgi:predicted RNA-binding protein with PIN domain